MKYLVEVEIGQKPTECLYSALVPELPGCFTTGESLEELQANLREAVELWIESAADDGAAHPTPTGFILTFRQIEVAV